ncbi:MAG: hypothetical protein OEY56_09630 [Cyclobacteriaceae bacterium]|nr:hypothetical protein [Cyclobacteriaceae bacterium]
MKTIPGWIVLFSLLACEPASESVDYLRQSKYLLHRAGYYPVRGDVVFTELEPGKLEVVITLENTEEKYDFPAHLHFGSINEVGELAFKLEDVVGTTGKSVTILDQVPLSTGEILTYDLLRQMNGSIKIHLADGMFSNIVLSYGNIGINQNYITDGVTICVGH